MKVRNGANANSRCMTSSRNRTQAGAGRKLRQLKGAVKAAVWHLASKHGPEAGREGRPCGQDTTVTAVTRTPLVLASAEDGVLHSPNPGQARP